MYDWQKTPRFEIIHNRCEFPQRVKNGRLGGSRTTTASPPKADIITILRRRLLRAIRRHWCRIAIAMDFLITCHYTIAMTTSGKGVSMKYYGTCSCSTCRTEFETDLPLTEFQPRICDCQYCQQYSGLLLSHTRLLGAGGRGRGYWNVV